MTEEQRFKEWLKASPFMWTIIDSISDENALVVSFEIVRTKDERQLELPFEPQA